ncbi:hypothetical protein [Streptomyces sp. NPDC001507]|uniref:hypothetical protein n=1 Tax=Streptomyces sp. NPDC001507 TaxID=3364579 RepID=UPI0036A12A59
MTVAAVTLNVVAALLELGGLVWTVHDIRGARRRLSDYLRRPGNIYASLGVATEVSVALTLRRANQTLEERVDDLEAQQRNLPDELKALEKRIIDHLTGDFRGALKATEQTLDDKLVGLKDYIAGAEERWWISYRGPVVLAVGVVVGLAGNIVSSLPTS